MRTWIVAMMVALAPMPAALAGGGGPRVPDSRIMRALHGRASFYAARFQGRRTASGERYNADALTAAHRTLPLGTRVRVIDDATRRAVVVRINDRGPYACGRMIDLSRRAAQMLGITREGLADVTLEILSTPAGKQLEPTAAA